MDLAQVEVWVVVCCYCHGYNSVPRRALSGRRWPKQVLGPFREPLLSSRSSKGVETKRRWWLLRKNQDNR